MPDISYPNTGLFPARAEPKAETPVQPKGDTNFRRLAIDRSTGDVCYADTMEPYMGLTFAPGADVPAPQAEPKAEEPLTVIALCDGSVTSIRGETTFDKIQGVMHANALAADRLVERIAKRVVEMQAEQTKAAQMYAETLMNNMRYWGEVQAGKRPAPIAGQKVSGSVDIYAWDPADGEPAKPSLG